MAAASRPNSDWLDAAMAVACGIWGWPPDAFWNSTPADMNVILRGLKTARRAADPAMFDASDVDYLKRLLRENQQE